jgi:selenide,water dikinase
VEGIRLTSFSHGAGCGCKLSPDELAEIMSPLRGHPAYSSQELVVGTGTSDDAGVWKLDGRLLVSTVDFFTPIVDDPFDWGRITAANALSDVYAMGGRPLFALQLVAWPRQAIPFDLLREVLAGGAEVMQQSGTTIVGGHSIDDPEPKYGFAVTGLAERPITNAGAEIGDRLMLTKPLGTGIISTAIKRGQCPSELAAQAITVMTDLNDVPVEPMHNAGVRAATDVTGFGLLGHLREMLIASGFGAVIEVERVPRIGDLEPLLAGGNYSSGSKRNLDSIRPFLTGPHPDDSDLKILADAQTSGGLLIAIKPEAVSGFLEAVPRTTEIGEVTAGPPAIGFR